LLLETNQFENYRIGWNEIQSNLFMKVKRAQKEQLLSSLGELERGIGTIDWIFIGLKSETRYIVSINKKGIIKETDNSKTNEIFTPGKEILEYFEWIYKHAKDKKDIINKFFQECTLDNGKATGEDGIYYISKTSTGYYSNVDKTALPAITIDELVDKFILPEKWCVKGITPYSGTHLYKKNPLLRNKIQNRFPLTSDGLGFHNNYYYYSKDDKKISYFPDQQTKPHDYTEITLEEFEKYILNQENMKKKIIGYKTPTDLWEGQIPKGATYIPCKYSSSNYTWRDQPIDSYNIPKEVVETWEPVYEELPKFKVGDWVVILNNISGGEFKIGEVCKIVKKESGNAFKISNGKDWWLYHLTEFRLATQKEIDAINQKEFYFGDVIFVVKKQEKIASTPYGDVTLQELKEFIHYVENPPKLAGYKLDVNADNYDKLKIKIGCEVGNLSELKTIYNYMIENE